MGCFVSTKRASTSPRKEHAEVPQPPKPSERSIEPSHAEEEKVKEILSVTTATKSESQKQRQNKAFNKLKEEEQSKDEKKPLLLVTQEETSEVSEVCSLISDTVSISTTTTAATEHREDAEETRINNRSLTKPQKNRTFTGDHVTKKEKKGHASRNGVGSARLTHCRDQMGQRIVNGGTRNQPRRRDPGETSFRRPATRAGDGAGRSVVGRCPSARKTNGSPRTAAPENGCRKKEVPVREGKWDCTSNETLENPLVSLECFIFI